MIMHPEEGQQPEATFSESTYSEKLFLTVAYGFL
jgi:hypothetical protein